MAEIVLSSKNQVVIPLEVRKALGIKPGDKILCVVRRGHAILLRKPKSFAAAIHGLARGKYPKGYLQKERDSW